MATRESFGETLESWLNKATDPANSEDRWDSIQGFYEQVNLTDDGPQVATRLLAHKIQSPQTREALQALTVLEACMNNCGKRFHSEATKFRFLNELIKVLSPKHLGQWTSAEVKLRVTEVLYSWTLWLTEEPKIQDAYRMLKKQGVVKKDPKLPDIIVMPPPLQRPEDSVFDQEDKAQLLARLLKSNRPEDLQTANRLIQNTIKEEQVKVERVSRRVSTLEEVASSTRRLKELLQQRPNGFNGTSEQDADVLKSHYERCDRLRPNLFRLASDTIDDDEALAQILQANDELTQVLLMYKETMSRNNGDEGAGKGGVGGERVGERSRENGPISPKEIKSYHLIDLSGLDSPSPPKHASSSASPPYSVFSSYSPRSSSPPSAPRQRIHSTLISLADLDLAGPDDPKSSKSPDQTHHDDLLQLQWEENAGRDYYLTTGECGGRDHYLRGRGCGSGSSNVTDWAFPQNLPPPTPGTLPQGHPKTVAGSPWKSESLQGSLSEIYVPLESIKPSRLEPITVYDQNGVHVSLHFAKDPPLGHPSVAVLIVSTVNTSALPVKDFLFQAAVPKTMTVKLQPSLGKDLPPYNPLLPPASLSQILLLSNPHRRKVRLRYKLSLVHGEGVQSLCDMGQLENFPDWTSWMRMENLSELSRTS